jgi:hypothetical protein
MYLTTASKSNGNSTPRTIRHFNNTNPKLSIKRKFLQLRNKAWTEKNRELRSVILTLTLIPFLRIRSRTKAFLDMGIYKWVWRLMRWNWYCGWNERVWCGGDCGGVEMARWFCVEVWTVVVELCFEGFFWVQENGDCLIELGPSDQMTVAVGPDSKIIYSSLTPTPFSNYFRIK